MNERKYNDIKFYRKKRFLLILMIGIIIFVSAVLSIFSTSLLANQTLSILLSTERIHNQITTAHLWLEENLNGDQTINIESDVLLPINEATHIIDSLLEDHFPKTYIGPDKASLLQNTFQEMKATIIELYQTTVKRINVVKDSRSGSLSDQEYDLLFDDFTRLIVSAETTIKNVIEENQMIYSALQTTVFLIVIILLITGIYLYFFYNKKIIQVMNGQLETERKLSTLTNNLKGMVYRCKNDKAYTMLFVSSGSVELTGYKPEELLNNRVISYGELILEKDVDLVYNAIQTSNLRHGHFEMIYRIKTKDKKIKYVWERGIEIKTNSESEHILEGFISDITGHILDKQNLEKERKAAESLAIEAQKANRTKTQFLANISHEIRTPLNGIIGFSKLLIDSNLESQQQEYAETVYVSGEKLLKIVNNVLDFSRIEEDKLSFYEQKIDIKTNLLKTASILKDQIEKKKIDYEIHIDETLPDFCLIDPLKLTQTIMNLLGNALKFTEKGRIEFHAEYKNQADLFVQVKDTGIGISEENQKLIFDYFTQADGSLTRKYGGTGIGLTLSKKIIEKMGGTLKVKSKIGEGSTFYFQIPLKRWEDEGYPNRD